MVDLNLRLELLDDLFDRNIGHSAIYREAQIILAGLDSDQRQQVLSAYYDKDFDKHFIVERVFEMSLPDADFSKKAVTNTPVSELLNNFQNRVKKKVVISRQELVRRYESLDTTDQLTFRLALLQSPTVSDNVLGCKYSLERWAGEELSLVESIWYKSCEATNYDLWYWSSRLLLRHASNEFILDHQDQLTHFRSEIVKALYYFLALKLCNERSFTLIKENLRIGDYYRVLYYSGSSFNENEWQEDFFHAIAEIYIFSAHYFFPNLQWISSMQSDVPRRLTKADEYIPAPSWFKNKHRHEISLSFFSSIRTMLLYGAQMGCKNLGIALHYLHDVEDKMIEEANGCSDPDFSWWPYNWTREQWLYAKSKIVIPCVEQLRNCCPEQFLFCFDERIEEYEKWLEPYVEKAKREGYENISPVYREGETYDIIPPIASSMIDKSPELQHLKETLGLIPSDDLERPF